ncbi:MAG: PVC-type heme-binding CxxCH protein, partial [Pirellulales bacterium]
MHRLLLGLILLCGPATAGGLELPAAADRRLTVELFAAEPDLVTPTGIAVDAKGRVLVVESHTHFRPDDYQGPPADRIRIFEDTDGDGRADHVGTFFEGSRFTMNLAVYHDGTVYVATRDEIFCLRDNDGDGKADQRTTIAQLETPGDYPHNGLSGFAFDFAGNVYFGLGENLGAKYRLVGGDGTELAGGGEGGSIYRMAADGSGLVRVATGFWNPFHVALDAYGRLFAVDNDPDSRPPCRLLHIVPDGDYGYRFRNGRKGLHPFTAWDGELPGTLPMVAGTGEAPSGVVAYQSDGLPDDYRGNLLCTSWGDHRLERYRLVPRGASFQATAEPFVTGGEDFRPVGIAVAPDGSLFVSDWVDKSYTLHGKGRVWKVSSAAPGPARRPQQPGEAVRSADRQLGERAARQLMGQGQLGKEILREAAGESDQPAIQALAISALAAIGDHRWLAERLASLEPTTPDDPAASERSAMAALLVRLLDREHLDLNCLAAPASPPAVRAEALRRIAGRSSVHLVRQGLADDDPFIRQAALVGLRQSAGLTDLLDHATSEDKAVRLGA